MNDYGWKAIGHTYEEQSRLRNMSAIIATRLSNVTDDIPTVPCISADGHLLVISAGASRVRFGVSATFIIIYSSDVPSVLRKPNFTRPLTPYLLSLWCIFDDGSVTSAYSYDLKYGNERISLLDCPLSSFASDELWRYNRKLRVYLASTTDKDRRMPIVKAFITVPKPAYNLPNTSIHALTLCTAPLKDGAEYLTEWIEFHRLVGFQKFAIYNTIDTHKRVSAVAKIINQKYPNSVDVISWDFSSLKIRDLLNSLRYFQNEALHDCLIRYGDQSEWLGALDLDEYIVPLSSYESVSDYLHQTFGRRIVGSLNLWSHFFCTKFDDKYSPEETNRSRVLIERYIHRAKEHYVGGREKYLYRPRFVQYLSIHRQIIGLEKQQPSVDHIIMAHYVSMSRFRRMRGCNSTTYIKDTRVRDRFAGKLKERIEILTT